MTKKTTKRSLLLSALSLLMCVSMLVGSTFAWFTDSVTSGVNKIVAGNLDVELEYKKVVNGAFAADWATVKDAENIFDPNALWEPGRVEVVYLKVSNLGSLALKYQLGVNVSKEIPGVNVAGEEFKLSDHLVFKAVDLADEPAAPYTDREATQAAAGTEKGLKDYNGKTTALDPKDGANAEDYVALIVYMPESVGNEANYRGTTVPTIELGVSLVATQYTAESDSFGKDYDKDAWTDGLKVTNEADLAAAINDVEEGGLIVLANDLTLENGVNSGSTWYEGYYYNGDKSFTIDLNGNTLTNGAAINDYLLLFKNEGAKENTITIKNGTLDAASSAYCALCTSTTSTQKITINLENVKLIGNNSNGAVAKIRGGAELNVKAGTVITGKNSYLGIENWQATVNIYDGAEIYQNGTSSYNGCLVGVGGGDTAVVNVYGGYGKGVSGGFIAMTSGGTINIHGGEWIANTDGAYANDNKSVLVAQSDNSAKSIVNVYGGTFKGGYNCYGNAVGDSQINISGGNFNADPSQYVADGYKAVDNGDGTRTVLPDVGTDLSAVAGYPGVYSGTQAKTYYISGADGLVNAAKLVDTLTTGEGNGASFTLMGNVNMAGKAWKPIDKMWVNFDGNGYTISNLTAEGWKAGFFGYVGGGEIKNLTLENVNVTGAQVGAFAGSIEGKITNCYLKGNNTITWAPKYQFDDPNGTLEAWNGIGAITGVTGYVNVNAEIVEGATVTLNKAGFVTDAGCTYIDNLTGYINPNSGTVVNNGKIIVGVSSAAELEKLANSGADVTVAMAADITGNVTIMRNPGADVIIDGNENTFTGMMTIIGNTDTGSLTIKNTNFVATAGAESAIFAPGKYEVNGVSQNNYVKHVTVDNCTFTEPADDEVDCAAIRAASGGKKYWTITNCTVDSSMHSFLQVSNIEDSLVVKGCKVYSKNGINLNYCTVLEMADCTFDVTGYAVRIGVGGATVNGNYTIDRCNLKSANDDGDAVIIFRGTMAGSTLTLTETTLTGTPDITNPAGATVVK